MTGLTTGAITGMIDRLEKAGYVQGQMIQKIDVRQLWSQSETRNWKGKLK